MMKRLLCGLSLLLLFPSAAGAQVPKSFTFGGQLRQRSEVDARDFTLETTPADVHLLRTRLNVGLDPVEQVHAFVQIQDSRRFGAGAPTRARGTMDPSAGQLDLHQAYFQVSDLFDTSLSLKVGRQELIYGNQRLVGAVGWSNVGRSFDAGVLAYEGDRASIDLFAARLVGTTTEDDGSQNFFGLYGNWEMATHQTLDVFALLDNDTGNLNNQNGEPVDRLVRFTPGLALRGTLASLLYEVEAAYQTGKNAVTAGQKRSTIQAALLSAQVSHALDSPGLTLGVGYTRLSGDEDPNDDVLGQFNTLFATNHKFYGFMDYFPATASPYGLQDLRFQSSVRLTEQVDLAADVHHFVQAEASPARSLQTLGQELDLTLSYQFAEPVTFQMGLSGFLPGDAMEASLGNGDLAYWGYVMSVINF